MCDAAITSGLRGIRSSLTIIPVLLFQAQSLRLKREAEAKLEASEASEKSETHPEGEE